MSLALLPSRLTLSKRVWECEGMRRWMDKPLTATLESKAVLVPGGTVTVEAQQVLLWPLAWLLISTSFPEPLPRILTWLTKLSGILTVCCFCLFGGCFLLLFSSPWITLGLEACLLPLALSVSSCKLQNTCHLVLTLPFLPLNPTCLSAIRSYVCWAAGKDAHTSSGAAWVPVRNILRPVYCWAAPRKGTAPEQLGRNWVPTSC